MIKYKKGDMLQKAPKEAYLLHACNAQGVWGSGIAKQFKEKFPKSFEEYKQYCIEYKNNGESLVGEYFITSEKIICLFTSNDYGNKVDAPEQIISATESALASLVLAQKDITIHSPKINSGLFKVDWTATEKVINNTLSLFPQRNIKWIVWEL